MKSIFKLMLGAGLAVSLVSCGSTYDPYASGRYPSQGGVYRAGDGTVYRTGEVYRDANGNVYQNGQIIRRGDVYGRPGVISRGGVYGNYPNDTYRLPPGQAKKVYGGRAKDYAPGQMKKRGGYYEDKDYRDRDYRDNRNYKKYKKYKDREDNDDQD